MNVEEQPLLRLVVMGKKSLPDPAKHGRPYWGYVELVTTKLQDIKDALKEGAPCRSLLGKKTELTFKFHSARSFACRGVQHGDAGPAPAAGGARWGRACTAS